MSMCATAKTGPRGSGQYHGVMSGARVLVFGLDSCDPALALAMVADGEMPNLAEVLRVGVQAPLRHELGVYVGSIWPTMMTGTGVARHGRFAGVHFAPGTYDQVEDPALIEPFWDALDRAGLRSAAIDVPFFPARPSDNTAMLVEWGCHDRYYGTSSWPADLVDEVNAVAGRHRLGSHQHDGTTRFSPCDHVDREGAFRTRDENIDLFGQIVADIDRKTTASTWMLDQDEWDLFVTVYAETHCVGHQLWHIHDPNHPWHDAGLAAEVGDPVRDVYRRADRALGEHRSRLSADATTYVILSHGMRWHHCANFLLDDMLHRLEAVRLGQPTPWLGPRTASLNRMLGFIPSGRRPGVVQRGAPWVRHRHRQRSMDWRDPPISHPPPGRLWFSLPNNTVSGGVRVNVRGREPAGAIHPHDVEEALRWLTDRLHEVVDVSTGRAAVGEVVRKSDLYDGPLDHLLPDLFVEWNPTARLDRLWSPAIGTLTVPDLPPRSGDHSDEGLMIACGPGLTARREPPMHGVDVAPTIAAALGVRLDEPDGSPRPTLVPSRTSRLSDRPIVRDEVTRSSAPLSTRDQVAQLSAEVARLRTELEARSHGLAADIIATSSWIRAADVPETLLISVVLPTHDRSSLVGRAIRSVLDQTYANVELLVVDDHSSDDTWDQISSHTDPRVRSVRSPGEPGVAGARNHALSLASGDVITYLDDDNWFDSDWLRAVAWLFGQQPETTIAYGIRVVDDVERHRENRSGGLPWAQLVPWDREHSRHNNLIDINVLAHRPSSIRFDPLCNGVLDDWDMIRALTVGADPVAIPVIAAYYTTDAPSRLSDLPADEVEQIRQQVASKWQSVDDRATFGGATLSAGG